ncbi:MAG: helicase [Propionibacteriales bacterium]|nr:helicase [Propionibacteriales bacterium]
MVATGLLAVLSVVCLLASALAALVAVQHRAAAAADLAALAGATSPSRACETAAAVARDNGAVLDRCESVGPVVTVQVLVETDMPFGFAPTIRGRARSGPAVLATTK